MQSLANYSSQMQKTLKTLTCVTASIVVLALLSYATTVHYGENDWPAASLQIRVMDTAGLPVEGATLSVFRANKPVPEFQQAYCYTSSWASNKDGTIDVLVKPLRWQVASYRLFWLIPFRQSDVEFEARIDATGFETARLPLHTLINSAAFQGRRPIDEAATKKGFPLDEFDVLHATVILDR
jgi:hypothetical protein